MARFRITFNRPVEIGGEMLTQWTTECDRLVGLSADGEIVMEAAADVVARLDRGPTARSEELKTRNANHGTAWTDEERAVLRELHARKASRKEMMEQLGRSSGGIRGELLRLGLEKRKERSEAE